MRAALARQEWDIVLSDYDMPAFSAFAALSVLTSFETFQELRRHAGLPLREVTRTVQEAASRLLD